MFGVCGCVARLVFANVCDQSGRLSELKGAEEPTRGF
jgi:hypothetical protein